MANRSVQDPSPQRFSNVWIERAVLGRILLEQVIPEELKFLDPAELYDSLTRALYTAMLAVQAKGLLVDVALVTQQLRVDKSLSEQELADVPDYLEKCYRLYPAPSMDRAYAQQLVDLACKREMWAQAQGFLVNLANGNLDHLPADEIRARHIAKLQELKVAYAEPESATWADLEGLIGPISWDWPGWLARGFLAILAGEPGLGKSLLALRLCACYLRGDNWPDGTPFSDRTDACDGTSSCDGMSSCGITGAEGSVPSDDNTSAHCAVAPEGDAPLHDAAQPESALPRRRYSSLPAAPPRKADAPCKAEGPQVLWCETEAAQVLNWERAKSWGLPLDRILTPLGALEDVSLDNAVHRRAISNRAHRPEVRLVVVDAFSGASRRDENSSERLAVVRWLAALARDTGKPVLLIHHLRKRGLLDGDRRVSLERLRGHSSIVQPARTILALDVPDPNREEQKRMSVIKSNLAPFPKPLGFTVTDRGEIQFGQAPEPPQTLPARDRAVEALKEMLKGGPMHVDELMADLRDRGISRPTARRAKTVLGVVSNKQNGGWTWELPGSC